MDGWVWNERLLLLKMMRASEISSLLAAAAAAAAAAVTQTHFDLGCAKARVALERTKTRFVFVEDAHANGGQPQNTEEI